MMEVMTRPLTQADLPLDALKDFRPHQVTRKVKYLEQGAYKIMEPAEEVVPEILALEPRDLQLEYIL